MEQDIQEKHPTESFKKKDLIIGRMYYLFVLTNKQERKYKKYNAVLMEINGDNLHFSVTAEQSGRVEQGLPIGSLVLSLNKDVFYYLEMCNFILEEGMTFERVTFESALIPTKETDRFPTREEVRITMDERYPEGLPTRRFILDTITELSLNKGIRTVTFRSDKTEESNSYYIEEYKNDKVIMEDRDFLNSKKYNVELYLLRHCNKLVVSW